MPDTSAITVHPHTQNAQLVYVTLNNPARRNAISYQMWRDLTQTLTALEQNADVRVVVLRGSGDRAFCAGADISEFKHWRATRERRLEYDETTAAGAASLLGFTKPLIACIQGYCIGAGFEIALQCDIRLCSEHAVFAITPARLGLGYNLRDTQLLVDRLGADTATELLFTGRRFDATEAQRLGIVAGHYPHAEFQQTVDRYALEIAANAPLSVQASKAIIRECCKPSGERDHELCETLVDRCYQSHDFKEGQSAFSEKRKAVFTGS